MEGGGHCGGADLHVWGSVAAVLSLSPVWSTCTVYFHAEVVFPADGGFRAVGVDHVDQSREIYFGHWRRSFGMFGSSSSCRILEIVGILKFVANVEFGGRCRRSSSTIIPLSDNIFHLRSVSTSCCVEDQHDLLLQIRNRQDKNRFCADCSLS